MKPIITASHLLFICISVCTKCKGARIKANWIVHHRWWWRRTQTTQHSKKLRRLSLQRRTELPKVDWQTRPIIDSSVIFFFFFFFAYLCAYGVLNWPLCSIIVGIVLARFFMRLNYTSSLLSTDVVAAVAVLWRSNTHDLTRHPNNGQWTSCFGVPPVPLK